MSSKCWVERCSDGQAEETELEKHREKGKEKEETEAAHGDNQPAGSMRQEGPGTEESSSPDHSGGQVVTSEGGLQQTQREETQTGKERKRCSAGPGARGVARHLRMSKPRGLLNCSRDRGRQSEEPGGLGPFYFIGGSNGAEIVSNYCKSRGWKRSYDKHREDFKLKWCETKSATNYSHFKEGKQLLYQIPNNKVLTTKIGLLSSLREYERVSSKVKHGQELRRMKMEEFIPTTFRLDVREERETFFAQQEGLSMWICKPTGLNQGRGIFLLKSQEDVAAFRLKLQHMEESMVKRKIHQRQPQAHIVQHYIQSPLLLKGKKFDVRSYLLIACTAPYMVFFRHGYVRLTCDLYDPSSNNLSAHLTNQYMQKKNPLYSQLKEDTVWSMESFNAYVNDRFQVAKGLPRDWVLGVFAKRMQEIMTHCFFAVKPKLDCRLGFFDLIGCDFLVDEDFKVWLLEMNCNPALHTNCEVLKEVIPSTVMETLDLTLEIFNKCRLRQSILPLDSQREFMLIYSGVLTPSMLASNKSKRNTDFHLKTKKKTEARWCTSRTEGNGVPTDSSDKSVNAAVRGEGRASVFDHSPTAFPLHPNNSSIQEPSHEPSSTSSTHTIRNKNTRPRAELKLSKCTLHHRLKAADDLKNSNAQQSTTLIVCLTSQAQREQSSTGGSPERPLPSCTGPPACTDEHEEEKLKEDVTSVEHQRKEEL